MHHKEIIMNRFCTDFLHISADVYLCTLAQCTFNVMQSSFIYSLWTLKNEMFNASNTDMYKTHTIEGEFSWARLRWAVLLERGMLHVDTFITVRSDDFLDQTVLSLPHVAMRPSSGMPCYTLHHVLMSFQQLTNAWPKNLLQKCPIERALNHWMDCIPGWKLTSQDWQQQGSLPLAICSISGLHAYAKSSKVEPITILVPLSPRS